LPLFRHSTGWVRAISSGWQVSGITTLQSGLPFTIFDTAGGSAFIGTGSTSTLTASLAPGATIGSGYTTGDIHNRLNGYVNINNFVKAPLLYSQTQCNADGNFCGTDFGNLGRNIYRGPHQQNWDFSLIKNIRITERQRIRFTSDFFNIWNHTNFSSPASTDVESSGNFGVITSPKGTPRIVQFSLRYAF
jgi:hypothetical protein